MGGFPSLGEPCPAFADRRYADRFSKFQRGSDLGTAKREGRFGRSLTLPEASPSSTCAGASQSCSCSLSCSIFDRIW